MQVLGMARTQTRSVVPTVGDWPSSDRQEMLRLWFVPNPRIRTVTAGKEATRLVARIRSRDLDPIPEEEELFLALHTSAYRASRPVSQRRAAVMVRQAWIERWAVLRDYIVERNLGLAHSIIRRSGPWHMDEDDLESEALLALARAVDRFNPWRGWRFSTYACNIIARALTRRGRQESRYRRLFPVQQDVTHEHWKSVSDRGVGLYIERLHHVLDDNLGELTDLESRVLSDRFPPEYKLRLSFEEIGKAVGLSKERVRQIQNTALAKLKAALKVDPVLQ